ncbi:MAG: FlaD/FlaE family flagellar protein [Halovenus sp.]
MDTEKPYLVSLNTGSARVKDVIEWMQYLGETFGASGALSALGYYERLGWISQRVRRKLVSYLRGLAIDELHNRKYDEPKTLSGMFSSLSGGPFAAHARSLEYVAAIAGDDIEDELLTVMWPASDRQTSAR